MGWDGVEGEGWKEEGYSGMRIVRSTTMRWCEIRGEGTIWRMVNEWLGWKTRGGIRIHTWEIERESCRSNVICGIFWRRGGYLILYLWVSEWSKRKNRIVWNRMAREVFEFILVRESDHWYEKNSLLKMREIFQEPVSGNSRRLNRG